jgi:pimeloyl-ACP methyl ester carboxylesterase
LTGEIFDCTTRYAISFADARALQRWGLGRTQDAHNKARKGVAEWATVVEEVLDRLKIQRCSVMAHSAGAPYALAFANKVPERIHGDVCLLAPWVGGSESCKCHGLTILGGLMFLLTHTPKLGTNGSSSYLTASSRPHKQLSGKFKLG